MTKPIDYAEELNAEQLAVVRDAEGPCLVLAGAGSGKTRTIVYRVAYLIEHGVEPDRILLLTFTNKAANEMMTRIGELLGSSGGRRPVGLWGGTFHSVANRILRQYGERLGYSSSFSILDQDDSRALIKACLKELGLDAGGKRFPSPAVIQEVLSYSRNAMIAFETAVEKSHPHFLNLLPDLERVASLYDRKKRAANAMDFDDLLARLVELLDAEPALRDRLSERFRYILVDEFQDTNSLQVALIRRLAGPGHNLLVVGDDAQSIYSFRAADVRNILDFPKQYPGARVFRLQTNYRSTPEILDLANDVISHNREQFPKELVSAADRFAKPSVVPCASALREADFVADRVEEMFDQGVRPDSIAVLFRATHHSQALEFELTKRGIDYDYRGGLRFFDRAHVKDVLSFLRLRGNFADEAAWLRVLGLQNGIGEVSAQRLFGHFQQAGSLAKAVLLPVEELIGARAGSGWRELRACLEDLLAAGDRPAELIRAVLDSPYVSYLEAEYPNYRERLEDLEQMARLSEPYDRLGDFLAEVTLDESAAGDVSGRPARGGKVVLSTIHQAKGLEWESVFIIHLTASSFPNRRAVGEQGGLEEERRLFYVAVTRAKRRLFLSHPASVGRGSFEYEERSLFLDEVDPSCVSDPGARLRGDFSQPSGGEDEPVIEVGDDGEPFAASMADVRRRTQELKKDWKHKSFLRDV